MPLDAMWSDETSEVIFPVKMSAKNFLIQSIFLFGYVTDEHVLHRKHTHTGSVYEFDFSVQFIVQEEKVISRISAYQ